MIAGSPETVRQRMEDLIKRLHVGNIFCLMQIGDMPKDKCMHSTRLFAEKVMPKLRNIFPGIRGRQPLLVQAAGEASAAGRLPRAGV